MPMLLAQRINVQLYGLSIVILDTFFLVISTPSEDDRTSGRLLQQIQAAQEM